MKSEAPSSEFGLHENLIHKGPNGDHVCLIFDKLGPDQKVVLTGDTKLQFESDAYDPVGRCAASNRIEVLLSTDEFPRSIGWGSLDSSETRQ